MNMKSFSLKQSRRQIVCVLVPLWRSPRLLKTAAARNNKGYRVQVTHLPLGPLEIKPVLWVWICGGFGPHRQLGLVEAAAGLALCVWLILFHQPTRTAGCGTMAFEAGLGNPWAGETMGTTKERCQAGL